MRTVILGYSGFIGQHLLNQLNKSTGVSLRDKSWKESVIDTDVLINLVGKAHDHKGNSLEEEYYNSNFELVKEVYSEFIKSSALMLIHVSSLAALEEFESKQPLSEEQDCNPISWYGKSKRSAEKWLLEQHIPDGKKLIILRPPMVHGPGDKGNLGFLYKFLSKGFPYPLSSFDNKRSFISIDNFCYFINKIIENYDKIPNGIYHVADDTPISIKQIVKIIKNVSGNKVPNLKIPKVIIKGVAIIGDYLPIPLNSKRLKKMTSDLVVSNTKLKFALGIDSLPLTAEEGLEKTIRSFR